MPEVTVGTDQEDSTPQHLRIAFIMGGGVSLGTFSAGALSQVVKTLDHAVELGTLESCKLDVWSGASAGAVTLAMAVHELFNGQRPDEELERLWVESIDVAELYADPLRHHREPSLFSSALLEGEIRRLIAGTKTGSGHRLLPEGDEDVALGFTLSNMNGIRVTADAQVGQQAPKALIDAASTAFYTDQQLFLLGNDWSQRDTSRHGIPANPTDRKHWEMIAKAARASGAFPAAFAPNVLRRTSKEFGYLWPKPNAKSVLHAYVDGGLFNNEPLKMAIQMSQRLDEAREDSDDVLRLFIVIDPSLSGVGLVDSDFCIRDNVLEKGPEGVGTVIGRVASAVMAQAATKDWLKVDKLNNQLQWSDKLVVPLVKMVASLDSSFPFQQQRNSIDGQLDEIIRVKYEATSGRYPSAQKVNNYRAKQKSRIRKEHKKLLKGQGLSVNQEALAVAFIALFENAAGLRKKRKLTMLGIAPPQGQQPAGTFLRNFGGFFDPDIRKHDFELGRAVADQVLSNNSILQLPSDASANVPAPVKKDTYDELDDDVRKRFEEYVAQFALRALGTDDGFVKRNLAKWAVRWAINKMR